MAFRTHNYTLALMACLSLLAILQGDEPTPQKVMDQYDEIDPEVLKIDVPALIKVRSADDVAGIRKKLVTFIWKNEGDLPDRSEVQRSECEKPPQLSADVAICEKLVVRMDHGFSSVVYHFRPKSPNKRLAIFHQGHSSLWEGGAADTITFLLERGFSVLAFQMPLMGDNKLLAPAEFKTHNDLAKLVSSEFEPIRLFVEPVVVSLNNVQQRFDDNDVVMIGLSGGGWTTTLYAAIDPRVRLSFPVAGTLPIPLRIGEFHGPRDRGDWEQSYADLYKIADYLDLYVLGASGPGRKQRQVLNKYDSCCFAGVRYKTYDEHVGAAVKKSGDGTFDVFLDESHRSHLISPQALEKAIGPLLDERAK